MEVSETEGREGLLMNTSPLFSNPVSCRNKRRGLIQEAQSTSFFISLPLQTINSNHQFRQVISHDGKPVFQNEQITLSIVVYTQNNFQNISLKYLS